MIEARRNIIRLLILIACLPAMDAVAQRHVDQVKPDQYRSIHWSTVDGLGANGVNITLKDVKGFLWVGSMYGELSRFDGAIFKKFIPDRQKPGAIHFDKIVSLVEDSLHNIWIGTENGLSRYDIKADTFSNFDTPIDSVNSNKSVVPFWATSTHLYCMESKLRIVTYDIYTLQRRPLLTLNDSDVIDKGFGMQSTIVDTVSNSLWILGWDRDQNGTLFQFSLDGGGRKRYHWPCHRNNTNHRHGAEAMRFDRTRNSIWLNTGEGLLEFSLSNKQFNRTKAFDDLVSIKTYDRDVGIDIDNTNKIWLATKHHGIFIYDPITDRKTPVFSDPHLQVQTGKDNLHIYCDRDGIAWITDYVQTGIYELLPYHPSVTRYAANSNKQDSLSNDNVISIIPADDDKLWIGTYDGLNIFDPRNNKFEVLRDKDLRGITGKAILPLHIDTINQKAWLSAGPPGGSFDLYIYEMDIKNGTCRPVTFRDGPTFTNKYFSNPCWIWPYKSGILICNEGRGVFEVNDSSRFAELVIPFQTGLSRIVLAEDRFLFVRTFASSINLNFENKNGKWIKIAHPLDSLEWTSMFYNKKDQTYWVSLRNELIHYTNEFRKIKSYGPEQGYDAQMFSMLTDNTGHLWFVNDLRQAGRLNTATGIFTLLTEADGYQKQNFDYFSPGAKDENGNLYFGAGLSTGGLKWLNRIQPELYASVVTSSAYIRSLHINHQPYSDSVGVNILEKLSLRYNQNTITIETGIIDFYAKGNGRIRYKLESNNKEEDWQYGSAYYTIRYERLPPGSYRLVMQTSNVSNEFNSPEKILVIKISPPFWETWWFRTLAAIFILSVFYGIYRWRTATLRRQKRVLEQTVKERTAELVEEKAEVEKQKAKSDELLLNILPFEVAEELKEKGYTTAKSFDEVTILFSDIKGFTHVAEKLTAQELVKEIDTYFSAFDNIMQQYGLEKIKTIGDAYIAAGGLPEENNATAPNVIEAAIAMQHAVEKLKQVRIEKNIPYFELRIGVHTGPVVAGVVGIKKFQYDIWGDTVNLAARMEQSGVPGKINISQYTYEKVKHQFHCEHRGKIDAKNKGEIDMYFVKEII